MDRIFTRVFFYNNYMLDLYGLYFFVFCVFFAYLSMSRVDTLESTELKIFNKLINKQNTLMEKNNKKLETLIKKLENGK